MKTTWLSALKCDLNVSKKNVKMRLLLDLCFEWSPLSIKILFILSKQSFSGIPFGECLYGWIIVNGVKLNNEWERDSLK